MTVNEVMLFLIGVAASCAIFALLLVIYPRLRMSSGNLAQAAVEAALQPIIYQAICAAYRVSEATVDAGYQRLRGIDKKALADGVYALLPERIGEFDVAFVKSLVTRERFQSLVQDCFDQFDRFYLLHHTHFDEEFKQWASQNRPGTPAPAVTPAA